jgi:hypothetical protein
MASTYTPLGVELQATGENAGTWGTKTNTNLQLVEQISAGFIQKDINGGAQTTALSVSDGATGAELAHRMIEFTGTISGNQIVTIPNDVQTFYFLRNSTSGSHTVQFKYATGSGDSLTFAATDKGDKLVFASANPDATNPKILTVATGINAVVDDTSPQLGGDLDVNGNDIVSTSDADIDIIPNGTGDVVLAADTVKVGDSGAAAVLTSNGAGTLTVTTGGATDLILNTNSGTNSGTVTITDAANGDITVAPNGTGRAKVTNATSSSTQTVTTDGKGIVFSMVFGY